MRLACRRWRTDRGRGTAGFGTGTAATRDKRAYCGPQMIASDQPAPASMRHEITRIDSEEKTVTKRQASTVIAGITAVILMRTPCDGLLIRAQEHSRGHARGGSRKKALATRRKGEHLNAMITKPRTLVRPAHVPLISDPVRIERR